MIKLDELKQVTEALYQKQQQSFRRVVAEEARLRTELSKLDEHHKRSRTLSDQHTQIRAIGADVIWNKWVGRRKTELNMKLAQVLAIKEHHVVQVRAAYGKLVVVKDLIAKSQLSKRKKQTQSQLSHAIEQTLFR